MNSLSRVLIWPALFCAGFTLLWPKPLPAQSPGSREPLGQSSRRTGLVISEIMYNPADRPDGKNLEFIELFNSQPTPEDLSGWRLDGDADFLFPPNTILPAGGFLVIATAPADLSVVYSLSGVLGPFSSTNSLPNTRGAIRLRNRIGAVFLEARYDTETPWPIAADGAGHSLVLARPSFGEGNAAAWAASDAVGGSPGRQEPAPSEPLRDVVINEFLAHTDAPSLDFIELYNHGNLPADISGTFLTDARNTNKFTVPAQTILPPRGFIAFTETELGFALSSAGERIFFRNAANTRVLDAVRFGAQANGVSSGRSPDGALDFCALSSPTPATTNAAPLARNIVINEIFYNPLSDDSDDEFIELYNRGGSPVNLSGWQLDGGISFTFPPGTVMPADGYLVIGHSIARLLAHYPNLTSQNALGDYRGALGNGGDRIALTVPDPSLATNNGVVVTNFNYIVVNEVTYADGGRWGDWSDGGGSSLELIDPHSDNRVAANWADSDETAKAPWTTVSVTGVIDNGNGNVVPDQLQVLLLGPGECLIDNVRVSSATTTNYVANSTFENAITGWTAEGTQEQSGWETTEGFASARSYHLRASDRGDNQVNRVRTPLAPAVPPGTTTTIRANVRWLRGHPELLFRLRGNGLEAAVNMDIPTNPGTPGARNSRAIANAGPAISGVSHSPPAPAANAPVSVTARVTDPDGLASVQLRYRIDPSPTLTSIAMRDDGTGGDAVAGDGLYTATLPGQPTNTLVAFHVQATDQSPTPTTNTFPRSIPIHECLVRFGDPVFPGKFPVYRIWMTQATFNTWDARHNLNNTLNDVTFVAGNHRVIYNAGAVYAGSPYIAPGFTTPTGNRCGYSLVFPPDDPYLGDVALVLDWPGGHGNENTAIQEQMAYWIADQMNLPTSYRYFIRLSVNGATDLQRGGTYEAVLQPGSTFLEQWVPGDTDGDFFKIDRGFEFSDAGGLVADPMPQLRVYTTPDLVNGGTKKKVEKYRWFWSKRSFERAHDYTNLFVLADALNVTNTDIYTSQTEAIADVEEWMSIFAVEHIINNFDSWGHTIGKNMYMYQPPNGRWQLYLFDLDWLMLVSPLGPGNYTASNGPLFAGDDPTVLRMYNHPPFRRAYFRAVQNALSNAFVTAKYEAAMDARYSALLANSINLSDGQPLVAPTQLKTWFSQRRTFLEGQLNAVRAPFALTVTNNLLITSNLVTLTGTAPISVKTIEINGVPWPVTWTSVSNWLVRLPIEEAGGVLDLIAKTPNGLPIPGPGLQVTVTNTGPAPDSGDSVVINEIMYHPVLAGAEFVELFNTSSNLTVNLSGWRIHGIDYTFPPGSFIAPRSYRVIARDRTPIDIVYGPTAAVFDVFDGNLQAEGETIALIRPAGPNGPETVIDEVRYESTAPWPAGAAGKGSSLQLIDASRDNERASNWSDGAAEWKFVSYTAIASSSRLIFFVDGPGGAVHIDDVSLVAGSVPAVGVNLVRGGDFEGPLTTNSGGPWIFFLSGITNTAIDTSVKHTGNSSLHLVATTAGGSSYLYQDTLPIVTNTTYTLSYWYRPVTNDLRIGARLSTVFRSLVGAKALLSTPGSLNFTAGDLPPYPALWINEVQPVNVDGLTDHNGQHEPWVELDNAGTTTLALDDFYLANNYTNLDQWKFPSGATIAAGEFKVLFADNEPAQTTATELHAGFRLEPGPASVVLSRNAIGSLQVVDHVNYPAVSSARTYGSSPDGQPISRQEFFYVTPRSPNNPALATATVFINEWMAANTMTLLDPATPAGRFDDWFELYNPGPTTADLAGYFLTDNLTNKFQFQIPSGCTIPPGGFLLVWADNEPGQNSQVSSNLHVNFALDRSGEAIGLFAPNGTTVDAVTFGFQTNDVSQGRYRDGRGGIYFMTQPTPGGPNVLSGGNAPPLLTSPGDRIVYRGETVRFTAQATDPDQPAQSLSFSLDPGAPAGATLDAQSGVFAWPTAGLPAPTTNVIVVRVTDNGVPSLSDAAAVRLIVLAPPRFSEISRNGSQLTLRWPAIPGKTYRVEYADELGLPWRTLGEEVSATGAVLTFPVDLSAASHRFLRIVVVP